MFEVGKKYKYNGFGITYNCVWTDGTFTTLISDEGNESNAHSLRCSAGINYKEVKPKIKVDGWITIKKDGNIGVGYKTEQEARVCATLCGCAAILHIVQEVEEGEGL